MVHKRFAFQIGPQCQQNVILRHYTLTINWADYETEQDIIFYNKKQYPSCIYKKNLS